MTEKFSVAALPGDGTGREVLPEDLRVPDAAGRVAHDAIVEAIEQVPIHGPRTPGLGGTASTIEVGQAIAGFVSR